MTPAGSRKPYGEQIPMPNVQALADQGVLFREAYCGGPHVLRQSAPAC